MGQEGLPTSPLKKPIMPPVKAIVSGFQSLQGSHTRVTSNPMSLSSPLSHLNLKQPAEQGWEGTGGKRRNERRVKNQILTPFSTLDHFIFLIKVIHCFIGFFYFFIFLMEEKERVALVPGQAKGEHYRLVPQELCPQLFFYFYLFTYFWLHWVFIAVCRLSLVVACRF